MTRPSLDSFDARILTLLQRNARLTAQAIAGEVGLSPAACQKRLKRLRSSSGVIEAEVAILSPEAARIGVTAVVQVRVDRDDAQSLDRFSSLMRAAPEVTQCYYVTGEHNFVLHVAVRDMEAYNAFSRKYFIENENVTYFITSVVMDRIKSHGVLPVASDEAG